MQVDVLLEHPVTFLWSKNKQRQTSLSKNKRPIYHINCITNHCIARLN